MKPRSGIGIGLALLSAAALACNLRGPNPIPTPTPTHVIGAVEVTATAPNVETPVGNNCLARPSEESRQGPPCLKGRHEAHYDVTHVGPHATTHTIAPFTAQFSLWAVRPGELEGTAHLTTSLHSTSVNPEATGPCPVVTTLVEPFEWDVQLKGQYFNQPDGSVEVSAFAEPSQGPARTQTSSCSPDQQEPGVVWAAIGGQLVNGVYDYRQDNALPANSTGEDYSLIHIEEVRSAPP